MNPNTTIGALLLALSLPSCADADLEPMPGVDTSTAFRVGDGSPTIVDVFVGQTHMLRPGDPLFRLAGEREALIQAYVTADDTQPAFDVIATLSRGGASTELVLDAPGSIPEAVAVDPGVIDHRLDDAFTAVIPESWVELGLELSIRIESSDGSVPDTIDYDLDVGPRVDLRMLMFDAHFFEWSPGAYPGDWMNELEQKLPVRTFQRPGGDQPAMVFETLVVPPIKAAGNDPAVGAYKVSSAEDYLAQSGLSLVDGGRKPYKAAMKWANALSDAGGQNGVRLTVVNVMGDFNDAPVANANEWTASATIGSEHSMIHELGHALGSPHLDDDSDYPWEGTMYGIDVNGAAEHVGPSWGLDMRGAEPRFLPPVVPGGSTWKHDPMRNGGELDVEPGDVFAMFSDYTAHRMLGFIEGKHIAWNWGQNMWAQWDPATGGYTIEVPNNGVDLPIERSVEVISVMAAVSAVAPVNHVYPPIGPYVSGMIRRFDATDADDRADAAEIYCPTQGCDASLRVVQGQQETTYLLPVVYDQGANPLSSSSLQTRAINLRASDGNVDSVQLLLTPNAETDGLPESPTVLASWPAS